MALTDKQNLSWESFKNRGVKKSANTFLFFVLLIGSLGLMQLHEVSGIFSHPDSRISSSSIHLLWASFTNDDDLNRRFFQVSSPLWVRRRKWLSRWRQRTPAGNSAMQCMKHDARAAFGWLRKQTATCPSLSLVFDRCRIFFIPVDHAIGQK